MRNAVIEKKKKKKKWMKLTVELELAGVELAAEAALRFGFRRMRVIVCV